jgi:hypothetical protein
MDQKFIKSMVLAYANKHEIPGDKHKLADFFAEDIMMHMHKLRDEDIYAYTSIYDRSKAYQGEVIETYLDKVMIEMSTGEAVTSIATGAGEAVGGTLGGIASGIGDAASGIGKLLGGLGAGIGGTVRGIGEIFQSGSSAMGNITRHFITITLVILLLIKTSAGKMLSKSFFGAASSIGIGLESVGQFITKRGRYFKFRYSIIQKNAVACYKEAGVTPEDVGLLHYLAVGDTRIGISEKSIVESADLQNCFVKFAIEQIALLMKSYFLCLKNTGGFDAVENLTSSDIIKITSGVELSAMCQEYYTQVKEAFENFYHLLDFVYGDNNKKKKDQIMELKTRVIQERSFVRKVNNVDRFGSFPKKNPKQNTRPQKY